MHFEERINLGKVVAGVDEAGVSPLAGPVVAAAVILDPDNRIYKLKDSKLLNPAQREHLFSRIYSKALAVSVGIASVEEIDRLNIYHATMLAMERAIRGLKLDSELILIDGMRKPKIQYPMKTIIRGDQLIKAISAASIIAKVTRDRIMTEYHHAFPLYNFAKHKGYPTKEHQILLQQYGVSPIHRQSFAMVRRQKPQNMPLLEYKPLVETTLPILMD
ncbi:MAG: ribonuclease HII [Tatlockia sp.]|nr:ribonuclease HII [Tatlockia sp.]